MATAQSRLRLLAMAMCLIASAACDDNDTFASSSPTGPTFTNRLSGPPAVVTATGAIISGRVSGSDLSLIDRERRGDSTTHRHRPTRYFDGGGP